MKKILFSCFLSLIGFAGFSQIGYTFSAVSGAYTANGTGTTSLIGTASDEGISAQTNIGFTFAFGCTNYTTYKASANGVLFLGTTAVTGTSFNDLNGFTYRPIIAPLWEDLSTGTAGQVNYKLTGTAPNRVLTVEWLSMRWNYTTSNAPAITFQVKLYETSNRIEFVYSRLGGTITTGSGGASIGLGGVTVGDFYSLSDASTSPTASKVTETTTILTKPATGQIYRWDPIICSGTPTAGAAVANPVGSCNTTFTSTLSLSGASTACGLTYQWYQSTTSGGTYTLIASATAATSTVTVPSGGRFYKCVVSCGASSATSTPVQTSTGTMGTNVTLPYSSGAATTCGGGDNITDLNTDICGLDYYYTGEDRVYNFTPSASGQITIDLNSTGSFTGLMLYAGCPTSASAVCIKNAQSSTGDKDLCADVTAGTTYFLQIDSWASPACNPYTVTISAPVAASSSTCNMAYTPSTTTYSFQTFTGTALPTTDDVLFNTIINFGFPVCYDGAKYFGGYVASNAAFVFDAIPCYPNIDDGLIAAGGVATGYEITAPAPVYGTSIPRNAVLAPWHDIDPASTSTVAATKIQYATFGTAPNRYVVISWENIPMYSTSCEGVAAQRHSSQVKLFETTNTIEIHVKNKQVCASWNDGGAVMGLLNYDGTKYVGPVNATAHNVNAALTYTWAMTNTGYKFVTTCGQTAGTCLTLPIGFKSFYGERVKAVNHLYWETATESDLRQYAVQRSTDGINFTDIGYVTPRNNPGKYNFDDPDAEMGIINYYRIEVRENSGVVSHTDIYPLSSGSDELLSVSKLFPNPANTDFTIAFDSKQTGEGIINVYDIYGKLVKSKQMSINAGVTQRTVDVEELPVGVYYVEVLNNLNETITKQKLVIQK
jgi:hypothetical protein